MIKLSRLKETDRTISTSEIDDTTRAMIDKIKDKKKWLCLRGRRLIFSGGNCHPRNHNEQ